MISDESEEILEGATPLIVPRKHSKQGPGRRDGRVFFNAQMAFNRDVSVMFFISIGPIKSALDAMASTGARAVRIANEARNDVEILANDRDREAVEYIERNIELNSVKNCSASHCDLRQLLAQCVYDYVDLDPFGTPVPFVPASIQGCRRHGLLAITATDTASLSGTFPRKSLRRYGAHSMRSPFGHETGLRIMIGHMAREAAKMDRGIKPMLCFYADHYFRLHLQLEEGGAKADESLSRLGYMDYDPESGARSLTRSPNSPRSIGPLWGGPLHSTELIDGMSAGASLAQQDRCKRYLLLWREELGVNAPFFFENDEIASALKISPPPIAKIIEKLREVGNASRTHFSPTAFKTDLPYDEITRLVSEIA